MRTCTSILNVIILTVVASCASDSQKRDAVTEINHEFSQAYEKILQEKGTRAFPVSISLAIAAMAETLRSMDMQITLQDAGTGFLQASAPAPRPLDDAEWKRAVQSDEPTLKRIAARHVGLVAMFVTFEPRGLDVVITATVVRTAQASEVSLTMRLKEVTPISQGLPRREYAPPTAVSIGLDKIWVRFEQELKKTGPG